MEEQLTIFEVMRTIVLWLSPVVFLEGVLLLIIKVDKYIKLEHSLGKELGRLRKRVIPRIENNNYTFQNWMLKRTFTLGILFIIYSIMSFIVLRK